MRTIFVIAAALTAASSIAAAGPLDGVGRKLEKNGAFADADGFAGAEHKDGVVSISAVAIGNDIGRGGEFADEASVVEVTRDTGTTGVRVDFPND